MSTQAEVGVYYFPNYHQDERNKKWHGEGWTEWELVKRGEPRFEGHQQPKIPLWGYEDEADPQMMAKKIDAAADHAVNAFIFDWYWYEDGPFLQRGLEDGFLKAENNGRLKFSLMWANHDWIDIHPAQRSRPAKLLAKGTFSREAFDRATDHIVANYFSHPSYWRVNGGLYFSIYQMTTLIESLGGVAETREALDHFRAKAKAAGVGEIHLNVVVFGIQILPGEGEIKNRSELVAALGFDSVTSYVWVHHQKLEPFPKASFEQAAKGSEQDWNDFSGEYTIPYYPNITMGWDPSPRTIQSDKYDSLGYPFTAILDGNTPAQFEKALVASSQFLKQRPKDERILTINAWNEWTEGSYLEPDTVNKFGYLEAIKNVFG